MATWQQETGGKQSRERKVSSQEERRVMLSLRSHPLDLQQHAQNLLEQGEELNDVKHVIAQMNSETLS